MKRLWRSSAKLQKIKLKHVSLGSGGHLIQIGLQIVARLIFYFSIFSITYKIAATTGHLHRVFIKPESVNTPELHLLRCKKTSWQETKDEEMVQLVSSSRINLILDQKQINWTAKI